MNFLASLIMLFGINLLKTKDVGADNLKQKSSVLMAYKRACESKERFFAELDDLQRYFDENPDPSFPGLATMTFYRFKVIREQVTLHHERYKLAVEDWLMRRSKLSVVEDDALEPLPDFVKGPFHKDEE